MKKSWIILLVLIINLGSISFVSASVRINEVMADCGNQSANCEYIEIYVSTPMNLINWTFDSGGQGQNTKFSFNIIDYLIITKNKNIFLSNFSVNESRVIEWVGMGLVNTGDNISLYDNSSHLISSFNYTNSHKNKSFQFCPNGWLENPPTPGQQNNCTTTQINPPQNNTQNPVQNNNSNQKSSISLNIDWNDDEIINGEEFKIEISAENLKDKEYDVKVWIRFEDDDTIISDRYGEDSTGKDAWKSGSYYAYNFFSGPGDDSDTIKLRIREDYSDFSGNAEIHFKIKDGKEISEKIKILKKEKTEVKNSSSEETKTAEIIDSANSITGDVIRLGSSESKETINNNQKNTNSNIVYESKNEKIKLYAIIGFAVLCLGLVILILFNKLN